MFDTIVTCPHLKLKVLQSATLQQRALHPSNVIQPLYVSRWGQAESFISPLVLITTLKSLSDGQIAVQMK